MAEYNSNYFDPHRYRIFLSFSKSILLLPPWNWLSLTMHVVTQALEALNKKDITEIKSYGKPPTLVEKVLEAVMILRGAEPSWSEAKRQLGKGMLDWVRWVYAKYIIHNIWILFISLVQAMACCWITPLKPGKNDNLQTFSNTLFWMKSYILWSKFSQTLFLKFQLSVSHHRFR